MIKVWEVGPSYTKFDAQVIVDQAWPDDTTNWSQLITRSGALCTSPEAQDWQCGSFGPGGRWCHRVAGHADSCSDLFMPADKVNLTQHLKVLRNEEFNSILGKSSAPSSARRFDLNKLRAILREEGK